MRVSRNRGRAGNATAPEWHTYTDHQTGALVRQLTNYRGNSHHLYFTNPGWYDDGRRVLFGSDRANCANLFGLDLRIGEITQLTDFDDPPDSGGLNFQHTSKNPVRDEAYFWHGRDLVVLELRTLETSVLYKAPEGFRTGITNVTADGEMVCTAITQDLSENLHMDLHHGYVGMQEYWAAQPISQLLAVHTRTGEVRVVHEEKSWITHVNTSPTMANLLTYCHEGPWREVDHRIWGLDLATGDTWRIRPREPGERIGHEYWLADGERVGYQNRRPDGSSLHGVIRYDNTGQVEIPEIPEASAEYFTESDFRGSSHCHSNDGDLIVGDGNQFDPWLLLWRREGDGYDGPRKLAYHRGSFHVQVVHVHPRISPDNRQVLYTSDSSGYGNVYLADIPDNLADLPLLYEPEGVGS